MEAAYKNPAAVAPANGVFGTVQLDGEQANTAFFPAKLQARFLSRRMGLAEDRARLIADLAWGAMA